MEGFDLHDPLECLDVSAGQDCHHYRGPWQVVDVTHWQLDTVAGGIDVRH